MAKKNEIPEVEQEAAVKWIVNREEFEKIVILMNHSTRPFMDFCFNPEQKRKVRVVMEYDPDETCVTFNYYVEEKE